MKMKMVCLMLIAGFISSCADSSGDLLYRKVGPEEITQSYLESLEGDGKTLLSVKNNTPNGVRLTMTSERSPYISEVCDPGEEVCYFEYSRDVSTSIKYLSVDLGENKNYGWTGSCIVEKVNSLLHCNVSSGVILNVEVSEL